MITFTVRGLPAQQGSKRAFRNKHSGRIQQVESSKRVAPWRSDVRDAAEKAMTYLVGATGTGDRGFAEVMPPLNGPVAVDLTFRFPRPKSHYLPANARRAEPELRPSAPAWPAGKPDADKVARAVLDAITAICFVDDAQVVYLVSRKRYADDEPPGVTVTVTTPTPRTERRDAAKEN